MMLKNNKFKMRSTGIDAFFLLIIFVFIIISFFIFDFSNQEKILGIVVSISLIAAIFFGFTLRYEYDDKYLEINHLFKKIKIPLRDLEAITKVSFGIYLIIYSNKFFFLFISFGKKDIKKFIEYVKERNSRFQSKVRGA